MSFCSLLDTARLSGYFVVISAAHVYREESIFPDAFLFIYPQIIYIEHGHRKLHRQYMKEAHSLSSGPSSSRCTSGQPLSIFVSHFCSIIQQCTKMLIKVALFSSSLESAPSLPQQRGLSIGTSPMYASGSVRRQ